MHDRSRHQRAFDWLDRDFGICSRDRLFPPIAAPGISSQNVRSLRIVVSVTLEFIVVIRADIDPACRPHPSPPRKITAR
jgi:hypothetical protein